MYSNEASMASGNGNGDSLAPIVVPIVMEEVSYTLIPQAPMQPAPPLFKDQRIFVHAPPYHWHVAGVDMEARQRLVALDQLLFEFGQRIEAREAEIYNKLGLFAMKDEVQAILVGYNNEFKSEVTQMQRQLALLADKDIDKMIRELAILRVDQG